VARAKRVVLALLALREACRPLFVTPVLVLSLWQRMLTVLTLLTGCGALSAGTAELFSALR
jgi:hypothetical protein